MRDLQRLLGTSRSRSAGSPSSSRRGTGRDLAPRVSGRYRLGDVRHVVASPDRAARELGFTAAVLPDDGLPAFATAPLR